MSHWFADIDNSGEATPPYLWQPCLETGMGHVPCFEVWFDSEEACVEWIRENVIGAGLEDESPPVTESGRTVVSS